MPAQAHFGDAPVAVRLLFGDAPVAVRLLFAIRHVPEGRPIDPAHGFGAISANFCESRGKFRPAALVQVSS